MRTSRKTDFRKLKITVVTMTYHSQRPQCPSSSVPSCSLALIDIFVSRSLTVRVTYQVQGFENFADGRTRLAVFMTRLRVTGRALVTNSTI